jgi:hypothetical protein
MFQGLKPLAQSLGPFGTKTGTPVHIFEATPPFEDENDGEPPVANLQVRLIAQSGLNLIPLA